MTSPIPEVDYTRTAARPVWVDLPGSVHDLVASLCGTAVVQAGPPAGGGFTSGYAGRVELADGRAVFVKAGGPVNEHIVPAYRQEAAVLTRLPAEVPAPTLLASGGVETADGPWQVLVTRLVEGRMPGQPWTETELEAVHRACLDSVDALTPAPTDLELPRLADQMTQDPAVMSVFDRIGAGAPVTWGQPDWVRARAGELAGILATTPEALAGETATHGDVRADNIVIDHAGRACLLDWNWLSTGPVWTDFVGLLPLARVDGLDVEAWLRRSPLTRGVADEAVDAWLAVVAAYMLDAAERAPWPGAPDLLRVHQRRYARTFLDWLGARRGWA
jgi:aminoglycoside phosphotransferase (APT) family kinase protein